MTKRISRKVREHRVVAVMCRHVGSFNYPPGPFFHMTCGDCGAWLSLGPARDDDRAVQIEIAAARIADPSVEAVSCSLRDGAEIAGWIGALHDSAKVPDQSAEWAGWLAYHIRNHDEQTKEEP